MLPSFALNAPSHPERQPTWLQSNLLSRSGKKRQRERGDTYLVVWSAACIVVSFPCAVGQSNADTVFPSVSPFWFLARVSSSLENTPHAPRAKQANKRVLVTDGESRLLANKNKLTHTNKQTSKQKRERNLKKKPPLQSCLVVESSLVFFLYSFVLADFIPMTGCSPTPCPPTPSITTPTHPAHLFKRYRWSGSFRWLAPSFSCSVRAATSGAPINISKKEKLSDSAVLPCDNAVTNGC